MNLSEFSLEDREAFVEAYRIVSRHIAIVRELGDKHDLGVLGPPDATATAEALAWICGDATGIPEDVLLRMSLVLMAAGAFGRQLGLDRSGRPLNELVAEITARVEARGMP